MSPIIGNIIAVVVILALVAAAGVYLYISKRKGRRCPGCSDCCCSKPKKSSKNDEKCSCGHCSSDDSSKQ